jgi:acetyl-CoA C-acetyltransferase
MNEDVVLVSGVRTAVGKFGRAFIHISAQQLGAIVVRESITRAGVLPEQVEEVIMGNVISAGLGQNPARQAAIFAGLPPETGAFTVNKVCGSGLKAVILAAQAIKAGDAGIIVAGGMESMSSAPHLMRGPRWGVKFGYFTAIDAMVNDGLWDVYNNFHMAMTGERVAKKFGITREEADRFALSSHQRAFQAIKEGKFREEIIPVQSDDVTVAEDECVRGDTSLEKLAKLRPVFKEDGVLTAGNCSQLSDGAAALVVTSRKKADELGLKPIGKIVDYAIGGTKPEDVMEAPIPTVKRLFEKTGFTMNDMDLVEYNEAYATSAVVIARELQISPERFNIHGGAVALGHPIGCSGARILVTLLHSLKAMGLKRGLATLCLGGGNAVAMIVESL